jgi:hypothetical protein
MSDEDINAVASHCPRCGAEYRPGFTVCADDETPLAPGPAPDPGSPDPEPVQGEPPEGDLWGRSEPPEEPSHESPAVLGSWSWQKAWLLVGRLRSEGMEAVVSPAYQGPYYQALAHPYEVLVSEEDVPRARQIAMEIEAE